ncbi:MAG: polysaccharide biosynthesis tyrosine autokinase [Anaerolineaceae bacterium]|nr:MAG: polysaccharide biosynthesis tyrosine autokinase [Anaerolineaceae bacterium]
MEQRYFNFIRRWLWLIVLATVSAGLITYYLSSQQPTHYEARARLIIGPGIDGPNPSENDIQTGGRLMQTYAELATTRTVLQAIIDKEGLDLTPDRLEKLLTIRPTTETQFLTIIVEDSDPNRATLIANELSEELKRRSPTGKGDAGPEKIRSQMSEQATQVEENIAKMEERIAQLEIESQAINDLEGKRIVDNQIALERERLSDSHATLALLYGSLQQAITNQVQIVESAVSAEPLPSGVQISVLMGTMAGLIIGVVIALTFEFLDEFTVHTSEDVENLINLPTLAGINVIKDKDKLVTITDPHSPTAEAFRVLRTSIQFSSVDTPSHNILITSSALGEGRSTTAANLAVVMAKAGNNVLLIDADLRRPNQHRLFHVPHTLGLTSLLLDFDVNQEDEELETLVDEVVQVTSVGGLQLLTSGPIPPNPSELLGSMKMRMLLSKLVDQYDFVILDSPAVLLATDAAILSAQADATLLVAWAGKSRKVDLQQAAEKLREVNANFLGCVLNSVSAKQANIYYYLDEQTSKETPRVSAKGKSPINFRVRFPFSQIKKQLGKVRSANN